LEDVVAVYARMSRFEGDPSRLDEGIAFARDVVAGCAGTRGMSVLVDRETGRCLVSSAWVDEESMRASDEALAPLRTRAGELLGAPASVQEWELAIVHETHEVAAGCGVRATRVDFASDDVDTVLDTLRTTTIPAAELMDGFCRLTFLLDRERGHGMALTAWRDPAAMVESRDKVAALRQVSTEKAHATPVSVEEYELAYTTLAIADAG
jgi:hypothetical protein